MNFNRKRHKILKLLSPSFILFNSDQMTSEDKFGVSFDNLERELKYNRNDCEKVFSRLYSDEEVKYTNTSVVGLHLTQKGLDSFTNKKYLKENYDLIIDWIKDFVQIIIPILSLLIAFFALTSRFNSISEKIENKVNENTSVKIHQLQLQIDSLKNIKNLENNKQISEIQKKEK